MRSWDDRTKRYWAVTTIGAKIRPDLPPTPPLLNLDVWGKLLICRLYVHVDCRQCRSRHHLREFPAYIQVLAGNTLPDTRPNRLGRSGRQAAPEITAFPPCGSPFRSRSLPRFALAGISADNSAQDLRRPRRVTRYDFHDSAVTHNYDFLLRLRSNPWRRMHHKVG